MNSLAAFDGSSLTNETLTTGVPTLLPRKSDALPTQPCANSPDACSMFRSQPGGSPPPANRDGVPHVPSERRHKTGGQMKELASMVEIDAAPPTVWDVLTDFASYGEWNPVEIS